MGAYGIFVCFGLLLSVAESHNGSYEGVISEDDYDLDGKKHTHNFGDLLPLDYSIHYPPPLVDGKPVPVRFSVSMKNIPEINELKQMLSIEMNLRIYWQDTRLVPGADLTFQRLKTTPSRGYINLNPVILSKLWVPDIYTDYAKSVTRQTILSPPLSVRLYPNGTIRYSSRILMEMSCPMDFRMYPGDTQKCWMSLESYAFTREELSFSWRKEGKVNNIGHRLAHFDFDVTLIGEQGDVNFPSGSYPAIHICLRLHRRLSYHLLQTYVPSSLFVIISWISFLVPIEYAPGRLAISMTLLLTLTAMFAAIRQITPSVSYIKALDIWMVGCITFVFLTLAEFAFVLRLDKLMKLNEKGKKKNSSAENSNASWELLEEQGEKIANKGWMTATRVNDNEDGIKMREKIHYSRRQSRIPMKIDSLIILRRRLEYISVIMAPMIFISFNLLYWPWLLFSSSSNITC